MNWDYAWFEYGLSASLLCFAMFGMGATLRVGDFRRVARSPQGILLVLVMQTLGLPLTALLLTMIFPLPTGVAVGMILVAALPGGLFSNLITFVGKGNVALSVSATAVCTVSCLFTSVFVLKTFAASELPDDFSMPAGKILGEVVFCMLLPLVLGMVFFRLAPRVAPRVAWFCVWFSVVLLLAVVIAAMGAGRLNVWNYGWLSPLVLTLFAIIALWLTYGIAKVIGMNTNDSFTVVIEVLIRNAHLGVLLKASLFPAGNSEHQAMADGILYTLFIYSLIVLLIAAMEVNAKLRHWGPIFRHQEKPKLDLPAPEGLPPEQNPS